MSNPSLFFAIAGMSMSFAGFAGLFVALRPRDSEWRRYEVGQINSIILFAMTALFSALLVVPLATLVGEVTAFRAMSAAVLVLALYGHQVRVGTSWLRWSKVEMVLPRREMLIQGAPFAIVRKRRAAAAPGNRHLAHPGALRARADPDAFHAGARVRVGGRANRLEPPRLRATARPRRRPG